MLKEQFKDFVNKSFETVKKANLPLSFYQDEMVKYNIVMYSFLANIYAGQADKIALSYAEVVHSFMRVLVGSPSTSEKEYDNFLKNFSDRFEEIFKSIDEDEEIKRLKPDSKDSILLTQFARMIGSASELQGEEHLRITDMFILVTLMAEILKLDLEYIGFLLQKSIDELGEISKKQEPEQEVIPEE